MTSGRVHVGGIAERVAEHERALDTSHQEGREVLGIGVGELPRIDAGADEIRDAAMESAQTTPRAAGERARRRIAPDRCAEHGTSPGQRRIDSEVDEGLDERDEAVHRGPRPVECRADPLADLRGGMIECRERQRILAREVAIQPALFQPHDGEHVAQRRAGEPPLIEERGGFRDDAFTRAGAFRRHQASPGGAGGRTHMVGCMRKKG